MDGSWYFSIEPESSLAFEGLDQRKRRGDRDPTFVSASPRFRSQHLKIRSKYGAPLLPSQQNLSCRVAGRCHSGRCHSGWCLALSVFSFHVWKGIWGWKSPFKYFELKIRNAIHLHRTPLWACLPCGSLRVDSRDIPEMGISGLELRDPSPQES